MPLTSDHVLATYRFTNPYRAADRTTQFLIRNVQYNGSWESSDLVFRTLLFKLFNRPETWLTLVANCGEPCVATFNKAAYFQTLENMKRQGSAIYSPAYIIPSGKTSFGSSNKCLNHLSLIEHILRAGILDRLLGARSLEGLYTTLLQIPTLGPFLAFQFAIDLNYTPAFRFDEDEFVVPGPGAKSGIRKCLGACDRWNYVEFVHSLTENQDRFFDFYDLNFKTLFGRQLKLVDVQNLLCEFDKYARIVYPESLVPGDRSRIKRKYNPNGRRINYWFPPKWGIDVDSYPAALLG